MAKTLEELKIKLGLEGVEEIAKVKSSLKGLGSTADITGKSLQQIAEGVKNFSAKGGESINVIKGQVTALKGLQAQAAINSKTFNQLGRDIALYESKLKKAEKTAETSQAAIRRRGSFVKATPGRFLEREDFLRGKKLEEAFDAEGRVNPQFLAQQAQLNVLAEARTRIEGRLAAAVAATTRVQVDNNKKIRSASEIVKTFGAELNELPRTTNNLQMELRELRNDLGALVIGGEEYIQTLNRINQIQSQLDLDPLDPTGRKAQIRSRLGTVGRFGGETDPVAKSIARNRRRRERGALPPLMLDQPREASGLFRTIAAIGSAESRAATEMMGRSLSQVTAEIKRQAAASNGSVNSLNAQKAAFAQLRAGLDPTSKDFRELGKEIDKVERKLSKLGKKRFSLKGAAQTVGAVASAGIFGGAPGAAGALLGAPFGPGGAVIGGGIGTSAGVAAQQISEFTNYAASIRLAEKAMERILQKEKNQVESARRVTLANEAIEYAVNQLNVEREDATVGMTRLSAAVLGAGGTIETAALAFLGTTKAIKATKGSAEDVRGGLTALVQMFSKGKISAEELSGQLGERFPAAVTAFAEANDISTSELQTMLKNGEVGLDRLVKFLVFVTKKYSDGALAMAASAEESGERQKRSFDEVRRQLGEQLIDVGAKLQTGIADSLAELTPVIVNLAKAVAGAIEALVNGIVIVIKNFRNLIDTVLVLAGGAVLGALITTLVKVGTAMGAKGFAFSVALLARFIRFKLNTAVGALILKLKALALTMARNPITLLALGITALGVSMFRASQRHKNFIDDITSGVMSLEDAGKRVDKYKKRLETLNKIQGIIEKDPTAAAGLREAGKAGRKLPLTGAEGDVQRLAESLQDPDLPALSIGTTKGLLDAQAITSMQLSGARAAIAGRAPEKGLNIEELLKNLGLNNFETFLGGTGDKTPMGDIELALRRQMRGAMATEDLRLQAHLQLALDLTAAKEETEDVNKRINLQEQAHADFAAAIKKIKEDELKVQRDLQASLEDRQYKLGLITEQEYIRLQIERERRKLEEGGASEDMIEKSLAALRQELDPDFFTSINKALAEMRRNFDKLIDPANQVIAAATAIGDSFANSFKQVITGQASARQALASFFESVANNFADMAAKIIAEAIKMQAIKFITQIISSFIPTGGGNNLNIEGVAQYTDGLDMKLGPNMFPLAQNAQGGYVPGGFKAFNQGGVVSQPTLGMVGEGGEPEYIIPQSKMRESMARYSRGVRGPGVIPSGGGATAASGGGTAVGGPIDVRYTVERINSVDYVTADQFQRGMQQAAANGAKQGEQRALTTLRQNTSQRRRVGLS